MASRLRESLARQLRLPAKGLMGWVTMQLLKRRNAVLEKNAVRLCKIQPHHNVLEIGFGHGIGIEHALSYVKDGPGKIFGVDLSPYSLEYAAGRLQKAIRHKKVELSIANVVDLPYSTDTFDCVFHTNCYYFWPSMQLALQEIHRVMKPGANMVTVLCLDNLRKAQARGLLKYGNPDPVKYMCGLELSGFEDVKFEYFMEGKWQYQAIFAHLSEKPAYHYDVLEMEAAEAEAVAKAEARMKQKPPDCLEVPLRDPASTSSYF